MLLVCLVERVSVNASLEGAYQMSLVGFENALVRLFATALYLVFSVSALAADENPGRLRGALLTAETASPTRLQQLRAEGYNAVVLSLNGDSAEERQLDRSAAQRIGDAGFELWYWIEIARNAKLADHHPQWMASLQGHQEWRRFFKDFPQPKSGEVVKNYPWVPILYRETFAVQLARVQELLAARPVSKGVMLNDLQGAPSACPFPCP